MEGQNEFEKEILIPMAERVHLEDLKFDGCNPNRLSREGMERLKASIRKWGDIVPIVTNKDLLVADGEQRALAMKELGMTVPLLMASMLGTMFTAFKQKLQRAEVRLRLASMLISVTRFRGKCVGNC